MSDMDEVLVFPAAPAQQRLWFMDRLQPETYTYNNAFVLRLRGVLDVGALEEAISALTERHEVLRSRFTSLDGELVQVISPAAPTALPRTNDPTASEAEHHARLVAEARTSFDLEQGPLVRWRLFQLGENQHDLLVVLHHIISDGWSFGVLFGELARAYADRRARRPVSLPELPIQYPDFAIWQRDLLQSGDLDEQATWWKESLSGATSLELPTDAPRPPVQGTQGARHDFTFSAGLLGRLRTLAAAEGTTPSMVMLAAFASLLHRYSAQTDLCVGTPVAGRGRSEFEPLIGFFVNTIVVRVQLGDDPSFRALLRRVRDTFLQAYARADLPFDRLVEIAKPKRDLSRAPLFQAMFNYHNTPLTEGTWPGLEASLDEVYLETAQVDLTLSVNETPSELRSSLEYSVELFEADTVAQMAQHYETLLGAALEDADRRVSELNMLSASERRRLMQDWNATSLDFPRALCVHEAFEQQASATPETTAILASNQSMTYAQLEAQANAVANFLRSQGVTPDTPVAVCLERSQLLAVALLGVLKSGGCYIPIDPSYPTDRVRWMLEDSKAPLLLTVESHLERLPTSSARTVCLDASWADIESCGDARPSPTATPSSLCYIIYTSGSTGRPKGVMIEHRNVMNFLWAMRALIPVGPGDTLLSVTSPSFDIFGLEFYLPLITGARVLLATKLQTLDSANLLRLLSKLKAPIMQATPSMWRLLADAGGPPENLRILCGGEALPAPLAALMCEKSSEVWNLYGPTETTIWSTACRLQAQQPISIGRPIGNTQVYILDEHLHPTPVGIYGELFIGGDGVGRGYFGRPDLTEQRFVPDPFSTAPNARLYRTGDRVRWRTDGRIEFVGRMDNQVKVRGYRVELSEIEAALQTHPSIKAAAVILRDDAPGAARLVAYVETAKMVGLSFADLRVHLKKTLPDYMLPAAYVFLQALPLTPNGKVDRRALPAPEKIQTDYASGGPHLSPLQAALASTWSRVLEVEPSTPEDDFFELGGNSLQLVRLLGEINKEFGVDFPLRAAFELPTLQGFSQTVEALTEQRDRVPPSRALSSRDYRSPSSGPESVG